MSDATQPSTTEITTEMGIRRPDGTEEWSGTITGLTTNHNVTYLQIAQVHELKNYRQDAIRHMEAVAAEVGVKPLEFVSGHRLITRQRIVITLPVEDADPTIQFGSVGDETPWL